MVDAWSETFFEMIEKYKEKFGGPPTTFDDPRSESEWIQMMEKAIETGEPIPEPDVPDGAFI
jgi:hypothetical protein